MSLYPPFLIEMEFHNSLMAVLYLDSCFSLVKLAVVIYWTNCGCNKRCQYLVVLVRSGLYALISNTAVHAEALELVLSCLAFL